MQPLANRQQAVVYQSILHADVWTQTWTNFIRMTNNSNKQLTQYKVIITVHVTVQNMFKATLAHSETCTNHIQNTPDTHFNTTWHRTPILCVALLCTMSNRFAVSVWMFWHMLHCLTQSNVFVFLCLDVATIINKIKNKQAPQYVKETNAIRFLITSFYHETS